MKYSALALARHALQPDRPWPRAWDSPEPKPSYDAVIIVALAAQICGAPRNAVYEAALALRRDPDTDPGEAPELPRT